MSSLEITNIIFSTITAITAVAAIIISVFQIIKSNRQALFDRRLRIYLTIKWMKSLTDQNKELCKNYINSLEKGPDYSVDLLFLSMTNTSFLEPCQSVVGNILKNDQQRIFLLKMEELKSMLEETLLIFPDDVSHKIADFIQYYHNMLIEMYRYMIITTKIFDLCQKEKIKLPNDDKNEIAIRQLLKNQIKGVIELSDRLNNEITFRQIESKIKL